MGFPTLDFEKQKIRKQFRDVCPHGPPIFLNSFFQFWTFLGSSLNEVVVFNIEVTHAARFPLKTTAAFNEEPKKENSAWTAKVKQRL